MTKGFTGETFIVYSKPRPFTTPIENVRRNVRPVTPTDDIIQRQFIEFSSQYIEEIMLEINAEYRIRELTEPKWYVYTTQNEDTKVEFTPTSDGRVLKDFSIKFYPSYIRDIQAAIENLINDSDRPDTLGGHLARMFANNQGVTSQAEWNSENKLKDNIRIPGDSSTGFITINPLSKAIAGNWPFTPEDIVGLVQKIGVTMDGRAQHNVTIDDPNFPQFLVGLPANNPSSRDPDLPQEGRDTEMTPAGRPPRDERITKNQVGSSEPDLDQGYGYMSALALSLHQVRYQPPQLETFPTNITPIWYTTNLIGPQTPNIAWTSAQPVEQAPAVIQNWGSWFFTGFVGVQNNILKVEVKSNPQEEEACQTECPYSLFFPPDTCTCSCACAKESLAIWWSSDFADIGGIPFIYNEVEPTQASPIRSRGKAFNRNTIIRINGTSSGGRFRVGVKTAKIGVFDTPFTYIVDTATGVGSNLPIEFNLMDAIFEASKNEFGQSTYEVGGIDLLLSLSIQTGTTSEASTECPAIFVPGGRACPNCLGSPCSFGSSTVAVDSIFIGEESLAGDGVNSYT